MSDIFDEDGGMPPEALMQMMKNGAPPSAPQGPMFDPKTGLYQHRKLRKGKNRDFYDEVWDESQALDYTQGAMQRDPDSNVPTLQKDRDPRTFEADNQHNLGFEMRNFFKTGVGPKGYGVTADSPHYEKLMALLRCAPEREPEESSYIHDTLSNPLWSAEQRHMAMRALMEYNFDPNREWNSEFPLERTARMGDVESASILLQHGAHVHVQDKRGFNLLSMAIENGHSKMIPLLAKYGVEPKSTAAGDSPLMLAILRLKKNVKADPKEAYSSFYETVGELQRYGLLNNKGRKKDSPLIDPDSPEGRELENLRKEVGHDHKQMFQVMTTNLDKLEPFTDDQLGAYQASRPKRVVPFTNEGGVQSTPKSFFLSPRNMRDAAARKVSRNIMKNLNAALKEIKSEADFLEYSKNYRFGKESFFNDTIPKLRDVLNLDTPNPAHPNDTMLHHAARIGSPSMLDYCMRENCNLHAVNAKGDYAVHLVAQLEDKRAIKEMMTKLVGTVNPATGKRESLYDNVKMADMRALNSSGESFLEVVSRVHGDDFAMELAEHLQLGRDPGRDISPDIIKNKLAPLTPLTELRLTPVLPLTTDVLGAPYIGIDPNGPVPPIRKSAGNETPEEMRQLNKQREDDVYKITSMLEAGSTSDERKAELREALKSTLGTMPVAARVAVMNNAMEKLNENLTSDPDRKGAQDLNALRRGVYLRMASDLAQTLKDPAEAEKAIVEMELHTPEGKQNGFKIAAAIAAVEGDADAMNLMEKINHYAENANRARFANDPKYQEWYKDVDPGAGNDSPSPKSP